MLRLALKCEPVGQDAIALAWKVMVEPLQKIPMVWPWYFLKGIPVPVIQ
jgi:hypothetical protein